ncbi:MAG: ATP-binding protein [Anaerovoracaceae bacterium]
MARESNMKKLIKLQWKIFAFLLAFCGLLLLILWFMQTVFIFDMYKYVRKIEFNSAIRTIEKNIEGPMINEAILKLREEHEIYVKPVKLIDSLTGLIEGTGKEFEEKNLQNEKDIKIETLSQDKNYVLSNGSIVTINFQAVITPVNATIVTLKTQLYIITAVMILLSILLAFILARNVSRPIEEINMTAKELADANYGVIFRGKGYREIDELSKTLNVATKELSKVEERRRELLANVSHDLRTPLTLIYGYAEIMKDFPDDITGEEAEVIMNETARLNTLVRDILDVTKIESGESKLNIAPYNVYESILTSIKTTEKLVKEKGYLINLVSDSKEIIIEADEVKITQAFHNLLTNAINYTGEDKRVNVRIKDLEKDIEIRVEDTGEGIKEDDIEHIWERYYKAEGNHSRGITSSGIGLSIVKKIITLHNGEYGVDSEVGKGSSFWLKIPKKYTGKYIEN